MDGRFGELKEWGRKEALRGLGVKERGRRGRSDRFGRGWKEQEFGGCRGGVEGIERGVWRMKEGRR